MNEHDAGYRSLFTDRLMIVHLIRGFITQPWVQDLDLETLELVSGSFVSDSMKTRENDVIWRVQFRGRWLYVYLLLEFQSTVDRWMALRLMVYVGLLYQQLLKERKVETNGFLPPVLPIVLYNGAKPWKAPQNVSELIASCPQDLRAYQPRMQYFLLDENTQTPENLTGMQNLVALVFRFEKCSTVDEFEQVVADFHQWAMKPEHVGSVRRLARWIHRLFRRRGGSSVPMKNLNDIEEYGAMLKERIKQWEKELIEKGIEQGYGEALQCQLETKFGSIADSYRKRIEQAGAAELQTWTKRVLTAQTIEEVFGE